MSPNSLENNNLHYHFWLPPAQIILYGIHCLEDSFWFRCSHKADILAFCNGVQQYGGVPKIITIECDIFKIHIEWASPNLSYVVMNVKDNTKVLPNFDSDEHIISRE